MSLVLAILIALSCGIAQAQVDSAQMWKLAQGLRAALDQTNSVKAAK